MTLKRSVEIIRGQWIVVLTCFIVIGLGSYVGNKFIPRIYQSTALVQISIPSGSNLIDSNSLLANAQLAQTEAALAVSNDVLSKVVSHRKDITLDTLSHETTSSVKLNTELFEIDVQDASPQRAAALANDIAQTFVDQQLEESQQNNNLSIQQVEKEMSVINRQINNAMHQVASLQGQVGRQTEESIAQSQLSMLQQRYNQWEDRLTQLQLINAQNNDFLRIVQTARPEPTPIRPNVLLNTAAGLVLGLIVGVLVAILYETLSMSVRSSKDAASLIGYPLLATIWKARSSKEANSVKAKPEHINVGAYRMLSTNIDLASLNRSVCSIMVTSALSQEGKSTVAANLAIFMANAGKNTLLVDADLHCPVLHKRFDLSDEKLGLSNAIAAISQRQFVNVLSPSGQMQPLSGKTFTPPLAPYIHSVGIANLGVMPAGSLSSGSSALLDLNNVGRLLAAIKSSGADVVIFDTVPLLDLPDARILATKVDATAVVIDITRARKQHLVQVKALLENIRVPVLGCVVNKRPYRRKRVTDYYYTNNLQNPPQQENQFPTFASFSPIPSSHP